MRAVLSLGIVFQIVLVGAAAEGQGVVEAWISSEDMTERLAPQEGLRFEADGAAMFVVDPAKSYQTILGLGASLEHTTCANLARLEPAKRAEVLEKLVSPEQGIGMNLMRICIGTPDFTGEPWYSYDDMPPGARDPQLEHFSIEKDQKFVLPVLKLAREKNPDLLFYASPWSPPGWMKTCDDLIGGHLLRRNFGVYARYFVKFLQAYDAEGIPVHAVTVQNEPGVNKRDDVLSWWYPSCQWSVVVDEDTWGFVPLDLMGHEERDFIRDHLGPAFAQAGLTTKIWCFDHNFNNLWYPRAILSDPQAAQYVDGTAFHPYVGEPEEMGKFHDEFPGKQVFLSEGSTYGARGAGEIIAFFRNWASSYNAWVTIIDSKGGPNNGPFEPDQTCITLKEDTLEVTYHFDYYMYGQFMKFVQRGAVRIDSGPLDQALPQVAFRNPDGTIVLITANPAKDPAELRAGYEGGVLRTQVRGKSVATYRWPG